jgi:hypothetical protein
MKIDTFTKIVLTVIAVNLTIFTIKDIDLIPKVYANKPSTHLENAPSINYGLVPLNEDGTVPVKLSASDKINVNVVGIDTYDVLDVNLEKIGGGSVSYGGPIAVKLD